VEQIFHEAQQDPNLSHLITYTTVEDIMAATPNQVHMTMGYQQPHTHAKPQDGPGTASKVTDTRYLPIPHPT